MKQRIDGNMSVIGSIFWPTLNLYDRILQEIDIAYYRVLQSTPSCSLAQGNIDRLTALRAATDPNSGDVAKDYDGAYEATIAKIKDWMLANGCPTSITPLPGLPTTITDGTTPPPPIATTSGSNFLLPALLVVGGIYLMNKRNKRKKRK